MPTYEYACDACGATFERFQSITKKPVRRCPECRKLKVRRLIGAGGGFIFRGSGFYVTDYRSSEYQAKAKAESGASSSGSKAESEPASSGHKADSGAKGSSAKGSGHKDGAKAEK